MFLTYKLVFMSLTFLYNYILYKDLRKKKKKHNWNSLLLIDENIICILFKNQKYLKIRKIETFKISSKLKKIRRNAR